MLRDAINNRDTGFLKVLLNQHYYNNSTPTMSDHDIEVLKLTCQYKGFTKQMIDYAFSKTP